MRFLFVDRITSRKDSEITGEKLFADDSPFRTAGTIASGVIGEAIGQLVSWLVIEKTDFRYRPVYAFSDKVEILDTVTPGALVRIVGRIDQIDAESVIFSGEAIANGQVVQKVTRCTNFFMPLTNTEYENQTRERFAEITSEKGGRIDDGGEPYDFSQLIKGYETSSDRTSITAFCEVPVDASFYKDHFPLFPVTPIVVINEIIGLALKHLAAAELETDAVVVMPREVQNLKIKSFVRPSEPFEITVKGGSKVGNNWTAVVTVTKEGKKILQGRYVFTVEAKR